MDVPIVENIQKVSPFSSPEAKKPRCTRTSPSQETFQCHSKVPVLLVALDEARVLLEPDDSSDINKFRLVRRALRDVNRDYFVLKAGGIIFAVLVDTNARVHEFVSALIQDPSARKLGGTAVTPPFILTQTMDVMLKNVESTSKSRVLTTNLDKVWEALESMGRPLWYKWSFCSSLEVRKSELVEFAAFKLLLGYAHLRESYNDNSLHGVSSLFCRVGLRPHASDPMAMRLVADSMSATLRDVHERYPHQQLHVGPDPDI